MVKQVVIKIQPREVSRFDHREIRGHQYTERYKQYGNELEHVFEEKDLSVHIDSELNFEEHAKSTKPMPWLA